MVIGTFFFNLKITKNGFQQKKLSQKCLDYYEPYFLPNIATNLLKKHDFANRQHHLAGS